MKLRFRGACWDASVAATSGVPPRAQTGVPPVGTQTDPVLSLQDFLEKEGVVPGLDLPLRRLPRPPSTDLASWSCAIAIQRYREEEDALRLRFNGSGELGVVTDSELLDNKHQVHICFPFLLLYSHNLRHSSGDEMFFTNFLKLPQQLSCTCIALFVPDTYLNLGRSVPAYSN